MRRLGELRWRPEPASNGWWWCCRQVGRSCWHPSPTAFRRISRRDNEPLPRRSWSRRWRLGPVSQRLVVVVSPSRPSRLYPIAHRVSVGLEEQRVARTACHLADSACHLDGREAVGGGGVTQLAVDVVAHRPEGAIGLDEHRVLPAGGNLGTPVAIWIGPERLVVVPSPSWPKLL